MNVKSECKVEYRKGLKSFGATATLLIHMLFIVAQYLRKLYAIHQNLSLNYVGLILTSLVFVLYLSPNVR